jgi:ABC-type branched-subunit amino acid transport system ATPase component
MLEANGLCAGYGAIPVLYGVALSVRSGEAVGILGHNGMGKTTLLRTLIGALPATAGTIHFNHDDVTALAPHEIFPTLSAYDNLRLGLVKTGRKPEAAIDALLEDFPRLRPLLDRAGGALSGGEQQLLALARALAGEPSMLLLDEPTEGIQPSIIEEIAETLVSLREKRGLTIVLVEQNLDFIAAVSQRVLVIRRGRIGDEIPREHLTDLDKVSEYTGVHA